MARIKDPALVLQLGHGYALPRSQWMRVGQRQNKPVLAGWLEGETLRFRHRRMHKAQVDAALSNAEIAAILSSVLGREIRYVNLPPDQMKQALLVPGMPEWNANGVIDLEAPYREGGASTISPDIEHLLRGKPIAYEQFARDYASYF